MKEATFTVFCIPQKHHWCVTVGPQLLRSPVLKWINDVSFGFFLFFPTTAHDGNREVRSRFRVSVENSEKTTTSKADFLRGILFFTAQDKSLSATFGDFFFLVFTPPSVSWQLRSFTQSNRETCVRRSNLRSAAATRSLRLQMSEHPRCQRQTFTSRSSVFASHLWVKKLSQWSGSPASRRAEAINQSALCPSDRGWGLLQDEMIGKAREHFLLCFNANKVVQLFRTWLIFQSNNVAFKLCVKCKKKTRVNAVWNSKSHYQSKETQ